MKKVRILTVLMAMVLLLCGCSSGSSDAPNGMKALSNDLVDYNLYIPTGWVEDISTRFVSAYVSDNDRTNISMEAFETDKSDLTPASFWESYRADFEATFSDMELLSSDSMLLGGAAAMKYVYNATVTGDSYRFMQVICIRGVTVYIFTYTATPEMYDTHLKAVEAILSYFSFKN